MHGCNKHFINKHQNELQQSATTSKQPNNERQGKEKWEAALQQGKEDERKEKTSKLKKTLEEWKGLEMKEEVGGRRSMEKRLKGEEVERGRVL